MFGIKLPKKTLKRIAKVKAKEAEARAAKLAMILKRDAEKRLRQEMASGH